MYVYTHTRARTHTHAADAYKEGASNIASTKGLEPNSMRREHILMQVNGKARDRRVVLPLGLASQAFYYYVSSDYICVLILLCMCPQTIYVSSYSYICVLRLCMCPHTLMYVSSDCICVHRLLYEAFYYNMMHFTMRHFTSIYVSSYCCAPSYYYVLCVLIHI